MGARALVGCADAAASFLLTLSLGPHLLDPMLLLLGEVYTLGIKPFRAHSTGQKRDGGRAGSRGGR